MSGCSVATPVADIDTVVEVINEQTAIIEIVDTGPVGPPGPDVETLEYNFDGTASQRDIVHGLNRYVRAMFLDREGKEIDVVLAQPDKNTICVSSTIALNGTLILR